MPRSGTPPRKSHYSPLEIKYKYVLAWCVFVDSHDYFIKKQLTAAEESNAPKDAYSQRPDGTWRTLDDMPDQKTAQALKEWAAYVK
jgi:hypothetical protein